MNRRGFLKLASILPAATLLPTTAWATNNNNQQTAQARAPRRQRNVVLIKLNGGNDGLNTLVPVNDYTLYQQYRPNTRLPQHHLKPLDGKGMAMNPYMTHLAKWWNAGNMAWIQGVGYPHPVLSHFRSSDIWETASHAFEESEIGWLTRVLPQFKQGLHGIIIGEGLGPMNGKDCHTIAMQSPQVFLNQVGIIQDTTPTRHANAALNHVANIQHHLFDAGQQLRTRVSNPRPIPGFATSGLGRNLESVAQMILADVDTGVYKVEHNGFDTHARQLHTHNNLLQELAVALDSFARTLQANGRWDDVLVITYSEFGRRVAENRGGGTDHGAASVQLVMGGRVRGGIYGDNPRLNDLDRDGNLHMTTDFRQVYGTLATRWFGVQNPWQNFGTIPFI